jgi:prepilin-type N-terminal cleavage/methylation domain-containing protein
MQFLNAPPNKNRRNQGFTTIEMIITLIIVGILAAVATPSFLEANARSQVNETVSKIQGALLEAQTQAIRSGRNGCQITINDEININGVDYRAITYTGPAPPAGESPCLLNSRIFPLETIINFDRRNQQVVNFSFKGTITTGSAFTLWVTHKQFSEDVEDEAPCLVLSPPLGVIRTGFLDGGECTR